MADTEDEQGRVQGDGAEGVGGHAVDAAVLTDGGDDADARGKLAPRLAVLLLSHRHDAHLLTLGCG